LRDADSDPWCDSVGIAVAMLPLTYHGTRYRIRAMNSNLNAAQFRDEQAAYDYVEAQLWGAGPVCPHCGNCAQDRITLLKGKTTRIGLRKCKDCRKPFTVKMGTIFEDSHAPMTHWLQAIYLMCTSKKGISTRQLQRMLGGSMRTAWHMGHRIRLAMAPNGDAGP